MRTWSADETAEFEAPALRAVVIMLWKRKGSKEDLDQHRVICLLAIIGRVLPRVVGSRILAYVENIGLGSDSQRGFRANRATRDAALMLRIICELCGALQSRIEKLEETQR